MATLTGQQIDLSYQGLIKTSDNAALSATAKGIQDGTGGATNIEMSNTATNFVSGTVDFTGSTVSGLPAAAAGLEAGTGTNAMQSAASLTATAANASGNNSIALGEGAAASAEGGVAVGENTTADGTDSVAIGRGANANSESVAIGDGSTNANSRSVAIGRSASAQQNSVAVGNFAGANATTSISLSTCSIGVNSNSAPSGLMIIPGPYGGSSNSAATNAIVIGKGANVERATANAVNGIAIGSDSITDGSGAVAIGNGVTATTADTVSVKALETQTDGGVAIKGDGTNAGKLKLYCEDASGAHNVTLEGPAHAGGATYSLKFPNVQSAGTQILEADASGNLAWINTPSGGGGTAGLESGTGTDSMKSAAALTTTAADASATNSIAIGDAVTSAANDTTAIGSSITSNVNTRNSVMVGTDLTTGSAGSDGTVVIGHNNTTVDGRTVAIGYDVDITLGQGQAIGNDITINGADRSTAIGSGINIDTTGSDKIAIGTTMTLSSDRAIGIGRDVIVSGTEAVAIGGSTNATATNSVALGEGVTAATANTVSVRALETQTDSTPTAGGIIMSDAGGTNRRLNITSSGALQVDSNAVGGATQAVLTRSTGNYLSGCDVIYSSVLIPANTFAAGDILQLSGAMSASNSANQIWSAYWISTNGTVGGNATEEVNMGQLALSQADWAVGFQKNLYVNVADGTGTGTQLVNASSYTDVDGNINTSGMQTYSPDWTSDLYLVNRTCIQASNTTVAYVDHGAVLKKIN